MKSTGITSPSLLRNPSSFYSVSYYPNAAFFHKKFFIFPKAFPEIQAEILSKKSIEAIVEINNRDEINLYGPSDMKLLGEKIIESALEYLDNHMMNNNY